VPSADDRAEAANLVFRRHGAALPRRGRTGAAVVDQHQPLAFAVFKRQRQPTIDLRDLAGMATRFRQAILPVAQAFLAGDAQAGAGNAVGSTPLRRGGKIEERQVGPGIGFAVGIKQMVALTSS
jgi:hypothetical protein